MLLTQFRNKDLEQSIPIMFGLQELRIEKATSNDIFFHVDCFLFSSFLFHLHKYSRIER
jgi:hypothetical protein